MFSSHKIPRYIRGTTIIRLSKLCVMTSYYCATKPSLSLEFCETKDFKNKNIFFKKKFNFTFFFNFVIKINCFFW